MKTKFATLLIGLAVVGAACASDTANQTTTVPAATTTTQAQADVDRVVEVTVGEFSISDLGPIAEFETIEFRVTNMGVVPHEFEISHADAVDAHMNGGHSDHDDAAADVADIRMEMVSNPPEAKIAIKPGETGSLVVTFNNPEEQTLAVCLLPGHYEAGMVTAAFG